MGFPMRVQPTCQAEVVRSPAPPRWDSHPFVRRRVPPVSMPVGISSVVPFPRRPISPVAGDWVEGGIAASSARRSAASPITGTALQRMLGGDW